MRVWAALSGGVDSAVAAAIALEEGNTVVGVTLDLGIDAAAIDDASAVAEHLGIEHRVLDVRGEFRHHVVDPFVEAYAAGRTPNPCVSCNQYIKLGMLLTAARADGADRLVTGHYARVVPTASGPRIARAADHRKDQSYFLYRVPPDAVARIAFPLGTLEKSAVRARAAALDIPVAHRPESQDVCFLGDLSAGAFVCARVPRAGEPGAIIDHQGNVIGAHRGICHYTVGQRKGLPGGAGPFFVTAVDTTANTITVGSRDQCETLRVVASDAVWTGPDPCEASVCVRAGSPAVRAAVVRSAGRIELTLEAAVCAAPGQAAVCYDGDVVVGGGTILKEQAG